MGTIRFKGDLEVSQVPMQYNETPTLQENVISNKKFRLFEDVGRRNEHTKHFKMSDGSYRAEVFDEEVHFYDDEEGKFISIDNTLEHETCSGTDDFDGYRIRRNSFEFKLSSNLSDGRVARIRKGIHEILWRIPGVNAEFDVDQSSESGEEIALVASGMTYRNAFSETDIRYDLIGNRIKENLIVNRRRDSYHFDFGLSMKNLNLKLGEENQTLVFYVKEEQDDGNIQDRDIFIIPSPFMIDANGETCEDVFYELDKQADESYIFRITASSEWMNAETRAFPVNIDPMIIVTKDYSSLKTVTVARQSTTNYVESSTSYRTIGVTSGGRINRMYLNFTIPNLDTNSMILSAQLQLKRYGISTTSSFKGLEVRRVKNYCNLATMTWDTQNVYGFFDTDNVFDFVESQDASTYTDNKYTIDLTQYIEDVKFGGLSNNGIVIKGIDETGTSNNYIRVYSEQYSTASYQPIMVIDYRSNKGTEERQSFQKNDVKRAGQSFVNLQSGNLNFVHSDLALSGNKLPLNLSHIYNGHMAGNDYIYNMGYNISSSALRAGKGWMLNMQQMLVSAPLSTGSNANYRNARYIYIDGDGTEHYLVDSGETDVCAKTFVDDEGLGLTMVEGTRIIRDSEDNELRFDSSGFLYKIVNKFNVSQTINHDTSNRITSIVDGGGRYTYFYYNYCYYLDRIVDPSNKITYFNYDSSNYLISIQYPDRSQTTFTYESGRLKTVTDPSGYKLTYTYSGNKVIGIAESAAFTKIASDSLVSGVSNRDSLSITYQSLRKTIVKNNMGVKMTYIFNEAGETLAVYEDTVTDSENKNYITRAVGQVNFNGKDPERIVSAQISQSAENLVSNGSFAVRKASGNEPADWIGYRNGIVGTVGYYSTAQFADGSEAYVLTGEKSVTKRMEHTVNISAFKAKENYAKNIYVLSGWAKGDAVAMKDNYGAVSDRKFELRAEVSYSNGEKKEYVAKFDPRNREWQIAATAFPIEESGNKTLSSIKVVLDYSDNANAMNFDNIRLIKGAASITETKIVDSRTDNKLYNFDEIEKVEYASCGYCCNYYSSSYGTVTKRDMQLMLDDYEKYYSFSVRMNNGRLILPYARSVSFVMKDGSSVPIYAIRLKTITRVNNGKMESQSDPMDGGKKIIAYIFDADGNRFDTENRFDNKRQLIYSRDFRNLVQENEYDSYGNLTQSITYPYSEGKYSVNRLITKNTYSSSGNFVATELDPRNTDSDYTELKTQYNYSNSTGQLNTMTQANNQVINYTYDSATGYITGVSSYLIGVTNQNSYDYRMNYLTTLTHNGFSYHFEYDGFGNILTTKVGGATLLTKSYSYSSTTDSETVNFANGDSLKNEYDKYGRLVKTYLNNVQKTENVFVEPDLSTNSSTKMNQHIDNYANMTYTYEYAPDDKVKKVSFTGEHTGSIAYDRDMTTDRTNSSSYLLDGESLQYTYTYDKTGNKIYPDNQCSGVSLSGGFASSVERDTLGRIKKKTLSDGGLTIADILTYRKGGYYDYCNRFVEDRTTPYVERVTQTIGAFYTHTNYTYDKNGNIKTIDSDGTVTYTYDALNRLIGEDNPVFGKRFEYAYDAGGNITQKSVYDTVSGMSTTIPYSYGNLWKDQLTSYNGQSITYDAMGNPLSYLGATLSWTRGRMLGSYSKNGTTVQYTYNADGIRTQKVENGITHKYVLEGTKILREDRIGNNGTDKLIYLYDIEGIVGFKLKRSGESSYTSYYYLKNLQGDVTAIYTVSGQKVVAYEYDAWGNQKITLNTNGIATLNPYRYRSYYFDEDSQLYYLNKRYYDSNVGRFLNADSFNNLFELRIIINGNNLYSYCLNNSVNYVDSLGCKPVWSHSKRVWGYDRNPHAPPSGNSMFEYGINALINQTSMDAVYFDAEILDFDQKFNLIDVTFGLYKFEYEDYDGNKTTIDIGKAEAVFKIDDDGFAAGAIATAAEMTATGKVGNAEVEVGASVLSVGGKLEITKNSFVLELGIGWFGFSIKIRW